jgi:uncharacterized protein YbaP (TraB family)
MFHSLVLTTFLTASCLLPIAWAQAAEAPEEIVITGKVSGPPLWQVRNGGNTLWVFGLLSPLPPGLTLETAGVERVLAEADEALGLPDFDSEESLGPLKLLKLYRQFRQVRANDGGKTLEQVLPPDLYQQLLAMKQTHGPRSNKLLTMRPLLAAELLDNAATKHAGLDEDTNGITEQLLRLVRRHEVPLTAVIHFTDMSFTDMLAAMGSVPFEAEVACLRSMLSSIETDLADRKSRAEAWAYGRVGELYDASSRSAQISCFSALTTAPALQGLLQQTRALWLSHAERALTMNTTTFAILDVRSILSPDGVIEQLRKRGYEVIEP